MKNLLKMLAKSPAIHAYAPITLAGSDIAAVSAASITINAPAGIVAGQLLLVKITSNDNPTGITTLPENWYHLTSYIYTNSVGQYWAYKYATASEPASYTFTMSKTSLLSACIFAYNNARVGDFIGAGLGAASAGALAPVAPYIPIGGAVIISGYSIDTASITFPTPTGMTPVVSDSNATSPSYAVFSETISAAGSPGSRSSDPSGSTGDGCAIIIALWPSAYSPKMPAFLQSTEYQGISAETLLRLDKPSMACAGRFALAIISTNNMLAGTWTGEAGWTEIEDQGINNNLGIAYKVLTDSEPDYYDFTISAANVLQGAILLFDSAAYDTVSAIVTDNAVAALAMPDLTPSELFSKIIYIVVVNNIGVSATTSDTRMTNIYNNADYAPPSAVVFMTTKPQLAALYSSNSVTNLGASGRCAGVTLSLKPA